VVKLLKQKQKEIFFLDGGILSGRPRTSLLRMKIIQNLTMDAYERILPLTLDRKFCELIEGLRNFGSMVDSCIIWEINLEISRSWGLILINLNRGGGGSSSTQ
jgi:hypothetical protein